MHNDSSSPALTDCTFIQNSATGAGGGMLNKGSSPMLTNCTFTQNSATPSSSGGGGGGMWNALDSSPTLNNCAFNDNSATSRGGGMFNNNSSHPTLTACTFSHNSASMEGGGMYNNNGTDPTVVGCTFIGNSADQGGGMYNDACSPTVMSCMFSQNSAGFDGGGMHNNDSSSPTVTDCTFAGNAASYGGGMHNDNNSNPTVTDCRFSGNIATWKGGGISNDSSNPVVAKCLFSGNTSGTGGGMDNSDGSNPMLSNVTFTGNAANYGGGISNHDSSPALTNCILSGNLVAGGWGGGMFVWRSNPIATNCTFGGNSAALGGGMFLTAQSSVTVANCILWSDSAGAGPEFKVRQDSTLTVSYSNVEGGITAIDLAADSTVNWGDGMMDTAPLFASGPSGTWTGAGAYDPQTYHVAFTDINATWTEDELVGMFVNPSTTQALEFVIIGNTATTMTVWADWSTVDAGASWVTSGMGYQVNDYRLAPGSPCTDAADNDAVPPDGADLDDDGNTTEPTPVDLDGYARFVDDPATPDTGNPGTLGPPVVDMGVFEFVNPCGNGVMDPGEECDDGNPSNNDDCLNDCTLPTCGDGYVWNDGSGTEECDDGPENSDTEPDACRTDCLAAHCCDGVVDTGEECDTGPDKSDTEPDACRTDCRQAWCGDGVLDSPEDCDDGNAELNDGCDDSCRFELGACCVGTSCSTMTDFSCVSIGGSFFGFNSTCDAPDSDADGLRDECDECPYDGNKIRSGICGCGLDDSADADVDGVPDCLDVCPGFDDTVFAPECIGAIPTVSTWGLVAMALLLLTGIKIKFGGRHPKRA